MGNEGSGNSVDRQLGACEPALDADASVKEKDPFSDDDCGCGAHFVRSRSRGAGPKQDEGSRLCSLSQWLVLREVGSGPRGRVTAQLVLSEKEEGATDHHAGKSDQ